MMYHQASWACCSFFLLLPACLPFQKQGRHPLWLILTLLDLKKKKDRRQRWSFVTNALFGRHTYVLKKGEASKLFRDLLAPFSVLVCSIVFACKEGDFSNGCSCDRRAKMNICFLNNGLVDFAKLSLWIFRSGIMTTMKAASWVLSQLLGVLMAKREEKCIWKGCKRGFLLWSAYLQNNCSLNVFLHKKKCRS